MVHLDVSDCAPSASVILSTSAWVCVGQLVPLVEDPPQEMACVPGISSRLVFVMFLMNASDIRGFCQSGVLRPGLHHHAGVHLEQEEPQRSHEFLRAPEFPGTFSALGSDGILPPAGQLHHRGSSGYQPVAVIAELFRFLHMWS